MSSLRFAEKVGTCEKVTLCGKCGGNAHKKGGKSGTWAPGEGDQREGRRRKGGREERGGRRERAASGYCNILRRSMPRC